MDKDLIYRSIAHPELLDHRSLDNLKTLTDEYPYFQSLRLLYLKNLSNQGSIAYEKELKRNAVWVTDRRKLFYLLDKRVLLPVNEPVLQLPETNGLQMFDFDELESVTEFENGETKIIEKQKNNEDDELEKLILAGSAQLGTFFDVDDKVDLESFKQSFKKKTKTEPQKPLNKKNKLIDNFIKEQPRIIPREATNPDTANINSQISNTIGTDLITDTLAQIYVKQGNYEKAIFAYEKLSLKFPEKSIYFATQIKKIKELINNQ